jgi:threonine/homoserine/homoserine lactone efflux protein
MLPYDLLLGLIGFSFVSSITPGPNNMMLLASGLNFGFRRSIPHMLGISIGFTVMTALVGLGAGQVFERVPVLYTILKYVGTAYMLWLAWGIANSGPIKGDGTSRGSPMTFLGAAAFQWVNPKAWVMALGAITTYSQPQDYVTSVLIIALAFGIINWPSVGVWALFGSSMRRFLSDPDKLRIFNRIMALLLVASLWPVFAELFR